MHANNAGVLVRMHPLGFKESLKRSLRAERGYKAELGRCLKPVEAMINPSKDAIARQCVETFTNFKGTQPLNIAFFSFERLQHLSVQ